MLEINRLKDEKAMITDENFMRRCLELGRIALAAGDAPVGSLIVLAGKIVGEGIESVKSKFDPTAHAEILAVRAACQTLRTLDLSGATLYTNVEPCVMCAFAIRQTGIQIVIFGISNSKVGGVNSKFPVLTDSEFPTKFPPPKIQTNILAKDCEILWRDFLAK